MGMTIAAIYSQYPSKDRHEDVCCAEAGGGNDTLITKVPLNPKSNFYIVDVFRFFFHFFLNLPINPKSNWKEEYDDEWGGDISTKKSILFQIIKHKHLLYSFFFDSHVFLRPKESVNPNPNSTNKYIGP